MDMTKRKMREISIFRNCESLTSKNDTMLHQDDMKAYATWLLIEEHHIDKVLFRGDIEALDPQILLNNNISVDIYLDSLAKIGNPRNILITQSNKDTY